MEGFNDDPISNFAFPCLHPINPHMRRTEARLQTFIDNSRLWPSYRLRTTPEEIADAGMYFLGEGDRVKCWYCNGTMHCWTRNDDPWVEHAKWFPMCEYLLQRKGPDFVHRIVAQYPDLRRPILRNPANVSSVNALLRLVNSSPRFVVQYPDRRLHPQNFTAVSSSRAELSTRRNTRPIIVDPREEIRDQNRKIGKLMTSSEVVFKARSMGFKEDVIKAALEKNYGVGRPEFSTISSLVEAILDLSEGDFVDENDDVGVFPSSSSEGSKSVSVSDMTTLEKTEELRKLEESRNCKSCHSNRACVVFIPCGHLACCVECGSDVKRCPICRYFVQQRIKCFIA